MASNPTLEQKMSTFDTFTCFLKLPTELRLMIWGFTLPGVRVLMVSEPRNAKSNPLARVPGVPGTIGYTPRRQNPIALYISRESREFALKLYELCPGSTCCYADLSIDVLCFNFTPSVIDIGDSNRRRLLRIAVVPNLADVPQHEYVDYLRYGLTKFLEAKVEEVLVFVGWDPAITYTLNGLELEVAQEHGPWVPPSAFDSEHSKRHKIERKVKRRLRCCREIRELLQREKEESGDENFHIPVFTSVLGMAPNWAPRRQHARKFYDERKKARIPYLPLHWTAPKKNLDQEGVEKRTSGRDDSDGVKAVIDGSVGVDSAYDYEEDYDYSEDDFEDFKTVCEIEYGEHQGPPFEWQEYAAATFPYHSYFWGRKSGK